MKRSFLILIVIAFGAPARAQQAPASRSTASARPAAPTGKLLETAPEFSSWEIRFVYPDDQKQEKAPGAAAPVVNRSEQARRLSEVTTTKTGKIIHEFSVYVSGKKVDAWYDGKLQYEKQEGASFWKERNGNSIDADTKGGYVAFPTSGFKDLGWVSADTYAGTLPYGERACLIFTQPDTGKINFSDSAQLKKQLDAQENVAYIDAETRLPVLARLGTNLRFYRFLAPPTVMQTFPADLASEIKTGDDARTKLNQMAPRPY